MGAMRLNVGATGSLATALDRLSGVPRWRLTSVALALLLLAMPLAMRQRRAFGSMSMLHVEVLALVGIVAGWILLDRLRAMRVPAAWSAAAAVALAIAVWVAWSAITGRHDPVHGRQTVVALGIVLGGLVRGREEVRGMTSLVVIAAVTNWLTWDLWRLPYLPLRDLHLYLDAGHTALAGASPYLTAPIASSDAGQFPFVYPPFTLPLFEVLASLPLPAAEVLWTLGSIAAVAATFRLLGVRGRWALLFMAWPVVAQGMAAGNVASFSLFLFALGYRVGAAIVLSGVFKVQSMIPTLWLLREGRWQQLAVGIAIVVVIAAISLPVVGLQTWLAWPDGLRHFQESVTRFPSLASKSLWREGPVVAGIATLAAIGIALVARGRNALARSGLAAIVASPTLYLHGLSPLLAGMLVLGPELLWFTTCLGLWPLGLDVESAWVGMLIVGLVLLRTRGSDLRAPDDLSGARADLHPAGPGAQVWPDRARPNAREAPAITLPRTDARS